MKARIESGSIVKYKKIPSEFKGTKHYIGGFHNASIEEHESEGFYDVVTPSYNQNTKELGELEWDSDNSVFTYIVKDIEFSQSLAEMKAQKIENLKYIYGYELAKTDWIIIRDQELGNTTDSEVLTARATLRANCTTEENSINSKTTKAQVSDYSITNFR